MFEREHDTIFAPASGVGRAAIAVLRISGPGCSAALEAIAPGAEFPDRRAVLATLRRPRSGEPLDRALVTRFKAPRSFTGEEMAGGARHRRSRGHRRGGAGARAHSGLRPAEPGEFAWRAFINGKIDLAEVEGLADLVEAETEAQRRQAERIAGGALSRECGAIRASLYRGDGRCRSADRLFRCRGRGGVDASNSVKDAAGAAIERIDRALATADAGERLREGFTIVIAGPPNVGKSTLMNALAGRDVAITSPIPGTTRDLIEVFLDLNGYPVTLVDTAGIRDSADPIEQEGVARASRRAENADLTLWLDDCADGQTPDVGSPVLSVRSKIDLLTETAHVALAPPLWGRDGMGRLADHPTQSVPAAVNTAAQNRNSATRPPSPPPPQGGRRAIDPHSGGQVRHFGENRRWRRSAA